MQSANLPPATRAVLEDEKNTLYLSFANVWELAIKVSIGKLNLTEPVVRLVKFQTTNNNIKLLPITLDHLAVIETLPMHHKDPFDRLLIAQAQVENLSVISIDTAFDYYGVSRIWLN